MPKIMQTGRGIVEMWKVKYSGLSFEGHRVFRCGATFNDHFTTNTAVSTTKRILKISQHLVNLQHNRSIRYFLTHSVHFN